MPTEIRLGGCSDNVYSSLILQALADGLADGLVRHHGFKLGGNELIRCAACLKTFDIIDKCAMTLERRGNLLCGFSTGGYILFEYIAHDEKNMWSEVLYPLAVSLKTHLKHKTDSWNC